VSSELRDNVRTAVFAADVAVNAGVSSKKKWPTCQKTSFLVCAKISLAASRRTFSRLPTMYTLAPFAENPVARAELLALAGIRETTFADP
jgi:hypothetical protein